MLTFCSVKKYIKNNENDTLCGFNDLNVKINCDTLSVAPSTINNIKNELFH